MRKMVVVLSLVVEYDADSDRADPNALVWYYPDTEDEPRIIASELITIDIG